MSVCPCDRDGCERGRNGFAGRVQNHHVHFSFHVHRTRNGHINLSGDSKNCCKAAAAGLDTLHCRLLWALAIALSTGKNTRLFGVLDQNETRFFTYVSHRASSKALSRQAFRVGSFTVVVDLVIRLESLGSELQQS